MVLYEGLTPTIFQNHYNLQFIGISGSVQRTNAYNLPESLISKIVGISGSVRSTNTYNFLEPLLQTLRKGCVPRSYPGSTPGSTRGSGGDSKVI